MFILTANSCQVIYTHLMISYGLSGKTFEARVKMRACVRYRWISGVRGRRCLVKVWVQWWAVRVQPCGSLEPHSEGPGPAGPLPATLFPPTESMELRFERLARETLRRGRNLPRGSRAPPRGRAPPQQPFGVHEQRQKIYNFNAAPPPMFAFAVETRRRGTGAFFWRRRSRVGGRTAAREPFVLGRSRDEGWTRAAKHGCCLCFSCMEPDTPLSKGQRLALKHRLFLHRGRAGK